MANPQTAHIAKCDPCPVGQVQWHSNQSACISCPPRGINCQSRALLNVTPGYYVDPAAWSATSQPIPVMCPFRSTCSGGAAPDAQCVNGSTGVLCGVCDKGFYRADRRCFECPHTEASIVSTLVLLVSGVLALLLVLYLYLRSTVMRDAHNAKPPSWACGLPRLLTSISLRRVATVVKILVSYCQVSRTTQCRCRSLVTPCSRSLSLNA